MLNLCITFRKQYKRDAEILYNNKMLAAHAGKSDYPKIRTFLPLETSTNCIYDDMKEAEKWSGIESKIDIKDLTWEQREKVLRLLFAKLNGLKSERYAFYVLAVTQICKTCWHFSLSSSGIVLTMS